MFSEGELFFWNKCRSFVTAHECLLENSKWYFFLSNLVRTVIGQVSVLVYISLKFEAPCVTSNDFPKASKNTQKSYNGIHKLQYKPLTRLERGTMYVSQDYFGFLKFI